jgi:hypothetical protein
MSFTPLPVLASGRGILSAKLFSRPPLTDIRSMHNIRITTLAKGGFMAKVTGFVRTTISVPASLKRQMDRVKEPVNWSALAAIAFEQKLAEIANKKERKTMDDVISRLRASKRHSDSEAFKIGFEAGQEWAKSTAEARELERLADFAERLSNSRECDADYFFSDQNASAFSTAELLHSEFAAGHDIDRAEAAEFWEHTVGSKVNDHAKWLGDNQFLRGFVEGALAIWDEVCGEL